MATSVLISTAPLATSSTFATQVSSLSSTASSAIITDPAFVGYVQVEVLDATTVYSSADCPASSTFFASEYYASCCAGPCNLFTACISQSILTGPSALQTCTGTSTCKSDYIYQTSGSFEAATIAISCAAPGASTAIPLTYFRAEPTNGILSTNTSAIATANQQNKQDPLGIGLGGGIGGFVALVILGVLILCCCGCISGGGDGGGGGGGSGRRSSWDENNDRRIREQIEEQLQRGLAQDREDRERMRAQQNN